MSLNWDGIYQGEMIDGLLSSVDRAFAKANFVGTAEPTASDSQGHGAGMPFDSAFRSSRFADEPVAARVSDRPDIESGVVMVETREAHNLEVVGSNPTAATKITSGQQQAKADAALRPVTGVASGQTDSENGRATAGINDGAGCSPNPQSAPSVCCPECHQPTEELGIYRCPDCRFVVCGGCIDAHHAESHWTDGATSRERESQVRP